MKMADSFLRWLSFRPSTEVGLDALTLLQYKWAFDDGSSKIRLDASGEGYTVTSASASSMEAAPRTATAAQGSPISCNHSASEEVTAQTHA